MTKQQYFIKHYKLWNDLVEHPDWNKVDSKYCSLDTDINQCYLCAWLDTIQDDSCKQCPITVVSKHDCCHYKYGWYEKWCDAYNDRYKKHWATKIRDSVIPFLTEHSKHVLKLDRDK